MCVCVRVCSVEAVNYTSPIGIDSKLFFSAATKWGGGGDVTEGLELRLDKEGTVATDLQ